MSLSAFEIAVGGITSIPLTSGLVFLGYKIFGEERMDTSNLNPKQVSAKPIAPNSRQNKDSDKGSVSSISR